LPMSDDRVSTMLDTAKGTLTFQEYFVRERHQVEVNAVRFEGAEKARPAPGVIESIESAEAIVFAPSNPVTSIGPILAVPGIREALRQTKATVVAVSPVVGGTAVSGPAGELMKMMGWPSTVDGVVRAYEDFLDVLVVDEVDRAVSNQQLAVSTQQSAFSQRCIERENEAGATTHDSRSTIHEGVLPTIHHPLSTRFLFTNTIMRSMNDKRDLAAFILDACLASQGARA
ncbi:MAG: 2-phospho-L-lactate transferase CofD family protein, partial [Candidatus Korobacteraceae bacterium]